MEAIASRLEAIASSMHVDLRFQQHENASLWVQKGQQVAPQDVVPTNRLAAALAVATIFEPFSKWNQWKEVT